MSKLLLSPKLEVVLRCIFVTGKSECGKPCRLIDSVSVMQCRQPALPSNIHFYKNTAELRLRFFTLHSDSGNVDYIL